MTAKEKTFTVEKISSKTREAIVAQAIKSWSSHLIVSRCKLHDTKKEPGFAAIDKNGEMIGYIMYEIVADELEITILEALKEGMGVGTALINEVIAVAKSEGLKRVWLTTTNDNIHAIRYYQRFPFALKTVHINAANEGRKLKPQMPLEADGIPIAHEFEFEIVLGQCCNRTKKSDLKASVDEIKENHKVTETTVQMR